MTCAKGAAVAAAQTQTDSKAGLQLVYKQIKLGLLLIRMATGLAKAICAHNAIVMTATNLLSLNYGSRKLVKRLPALPFSQYLGLRLRTYILRILSPLRLFYNQHEQPLANHTIPCTNPLADGNFRGTDGCISDAAERPPSRISLLEIQLSQLTNDHMDFVMMKSAYQITLFFEKTVLPIKKEEALSSTLNPTSYRSACCSRLSPPLHFM